jgi:hypothetical protein
MFFLYIYIYINQKVGSVPKKKLVRFSHPSQLQCHPYPFLFFLSLFSDLSCVFCSRYRGVLGPLGASGPRLGALHNAQCFPADIFSRFSVRARTVAV